MAWNGFPGSSMTITGRAADRVHSVAAIRAGEPAQEADQLSDNQMNRAVHPLLCAQTILLTS